MWCQGWKRWSVPSGLFSDVVNTVVDRYQEAKKQSASRELIPRCFLESAPSTSRSRSGHSDRREEQKSSGGPCPPAPMRKDKRAGKCAQAQGLRSVISSSILTILGPGP